MKTTVVMVLSAMCFTACSKPEIKLICNESNNGEFYETYLISNPPKNGEDFRRLLIDFNKDLDTLQKLGERTFIKPHEKTWLDNIDYEKDSCSDIDIVDVLLRVSKYGNNADFYHTISYTFFDYQDTTYDVPIRKNE